MWPQSAPPTERRSSTALAEQPIIHRRRPPSPARSRSPALRFSSSIPVDLNSSDDPVRCSLWSGQWCRVQFKPSRISETPSQAKQQAVFTDFKSLRRLGRVGNHSALNLLHRAPRQQFSGLPVEPEAASRQRDLMRPQQEGGCRLEGAWFSAELYGLTPPPPEEHGVKPRPRLYSQKPPDWTQMFLKLRHMTQRLYSSCSEVELSLSSLFSVNKTSACRCNAATTPQHADARPRQEDAAR
ncbi:hypothetical protein EYF80_025783 [Liparis tanakae]|uniref:Uncharacterized protein n=1 Tax=Liparis tanakae TaxID=230148 RepID=A0A4Z2HES4_9TELE|nr:hypothetical protein EYF80_025783 [Liparis tanakae]